MDLIKYIESQKEWSLKTFGPGSRDNGIIDHIKKELIEIQAQPNDLSEWIDVVILALDGAWRAGYMPWQVVAKLQEKQGINIQREWPDWRDAEEGKAIEHIKSSGKG